MGLLQGPRLMAWTTKSPIWGNHWVLLGCRALLGSVKSLINEKDGNSTLPTVLVGIFNLLHENQNLL